MVVPSFVIGGLCLLAFLILLAFIAAWILAHEMGNITGAKRK